MSIGRDSIDPFRAGDKSLSASHQMEPLRMAATKGSTGENEISDATGIARRRGRRQATTTYLVRANERINGYTVSSGTKTVNVGECEVLSVDTDDGTIGESQRSNTIDVYNPFATDVNYITTEDNDFLAVKDRHGIYWVASRPPNTQRISCLVNDATGVEPNDTTIAVNDTAVMLPRGVIAPGNVTLIVYNKPKWRLPDNHPIEAEWNVDTSHWEGVWRGPLPTIVKAVVNESAGVVSTDADFEVDGATVEQESGASVATTLTFQNDYGFTLDDDMIVAAYHRPSDDEWVAFQAGCPPT